MKSKKTIQFINDIICHYVVMRDVIKNDMITACEKAENEMKEKAIDSFIDNCEYKAEWCCGEAEIHGAILSEPDICKHRDCPYVKSFIEKLNKEDINEN